jgi:hypothetical protein
MKIEGIIQRVEIVNETKMLLFIADPEMNFVVPCFRSEFNTKYMTVGKMRRFDVTCRSIGSRAPEAAEGMEIER